MRNKPLLTRFLLQSRLRGAAIIIFRIIGESIGSNLIAVDYSEIGWGDIGKKAGKGLYQTVIKEDGCKERYVYDILTDSY